VYILPQTDSGGHSLWRIGSATGNSAETTVPTLQDPEFQSSQQLNAGRRLIYNSSCWPWHLGVNFTCNNRPINLHLSGNRVVKGHLRVRLRQPARYTSRESGSCQPNGSAFKANLSLDKFVIRKKNPLKFIREVKWLRRRIRLTYSLV